jgi:multidrug efflux pump subunit AcrA (membrane-fusion protein)
MKKISTHHPILFSGWILLLMFFAAGCSDKTPITDKPSAAVKTEVTTVTVENQPIRYEAVGTVEAKTAAIIAAKVMGEIKNIAVKEGDRVKKGDLLVSIEDSQIMAQLRQAKAGLAEAKKAENTAESSIASAAASARLAEATYKRYKSLLESDSVSRQEFDEVEARYQQAAAALTQATSMRDGAKDRVAQAMAAVSAAESVLQDTRIMAPYDGMITAKLIETGALALPGTPLLTIEETGAVEVRVTLPETHIGQVNANDPVMVEIPSANKTVEGKITTIDPAGNVSSRSFQIKVTLPEVPGLRTGLFARVIFPVGTSGMVLIPATAIVYQGQLTGVFVLDEKNIARFRLIRIGRPFGEQMEVLSGIKDGDRIMVKPDHAIFDGVKVESI